MSAPTDQSPRDTSGLPAATAPEIVEPRVWQSTREDPTSGAQPAA